jgi:L-2,4-diaminobutyrate transaminase
VRPLPHGDILGFSPPLIVTREEIDEIVERCRRAVARVRDEMIRSGDWRPA